MGSTDIKRFKKRWKKKVIQKKKKEMTPNVPKMDEIGQGLCKIYRKSVCKKMLPHFSLKFRNLIFLHLPDKMQERKIKKNRTFMDFLSKFNFDYTSKVLTTALFLTWMCCNWHRSQQNGVFIFFSTAAVLCFSKYSIWTYMDHDLYYYRICMVFKWKMPKATY